MAVRFALPSPQRSPTPHPSFSCDGHSPCCRRRRRRSSAGSSSSPPASKRMCGPGASASAHLAPWKGHRRCTFHRRRPPAPSAVIVTKNSSLRQRIVVVLPAQICFLSSILGPNMSRFTGSPPIFAISVTMDLKRPQISSFREQNSVPPETRIPAVHARVHTVCPSSCLGSLGQIELQGGDLTFERISEWNSGSETAFIRPFDCATFL